MKELITMKGLVKLLSLKLSTLRKKKYFTTVMKSYLIPFKLDSGI